MVSIWSMMNQSFISYTFITYFRGNCISHHKRWEKQRDNKAPTGHVSLDLWNLWFNDHSGYHGLWSRTDCWKKETRNENKLKSKRLLQMLMYHLKMLSMKSKPLKSCRKKLETALESQKYVLSLGISIFISLKCNKNLFTKSFSLPDLLGVFVIRPQGWTPWPLVEQGFCSECWPLLHCIWLWTLKSYHD